MAERYIGTSGKSELSSVAKAKKEQIKRDIEASLKRIAKKKAIGKAKKKAAGK